MCIFLFAKQVFVLTAAAIRTEMKQSLFFLPLLLVAASASQTPLKKAFLEMNQLYPHQQIKQLYQDAMRDCNQLRYFINMLGTPEYKALAEASTKIKSFEGLAVTLQKSNIDIDSAFKTLYRNLFAVTGSGMQTNCFDDFVKKFTALINNKDVEKAKEGYSKIVPEFKDFSRKLREAEEFMFFSGAVDELTECKLFKSSLLVSGINLSHIGRKTVSGFFDWMVSNAAKITPDP